MKTALQVLSADECTRIHEETLKILSKTGVRVDTARGRGILKHAGAFVDESTHVVRFPQALVDESINIAPKEFSLGSRHPDKNIPMHQQACGIVLDGGAIYTYDAQAGIRRPATREDWLLATRLGDCLEDIDVYWSVIEGCWDHTPADTVSYWKAIFQNFSKHVQDATMTPEESRWMLEVLQIVFGGRDEVRRLKPVSFVLCPASPLIIEGAYTDAYLEILDWGIPAAVMTMPLMGISGPASLISQLILANCETIAMLCLIQAAAPGTPFIYSAVPVVADMHSGRFGSGEVEHSLLGAAVSEVARMYQLPVEASVGGSDQHIPCLQAGYERALNYSLPILSKPDLLVAPGLLGGSTIFSPEQLFIDLEVIRRCKRLNQGIFSSEDKWLGDVISTLGPGGNYLVHPSTRKQVHSGEIYFSRLGLHGSYEQWVQAGSPDLLCEIHSRIGEALARHHPLPLPPEAEKELTHLEKRARLSLERV
ncbi:MAG TPA: trimethylamine methyltransferase family protein [Anaerolineales bacterium]|nr:trimethylamine methyltransferase family protein [Anaerolineales bacterium]